jgi:hypothetical protein
VGCAAQVAARNQRVSGADHVIQYWRWYLHCLADFGVCTNSPRGQGRLEKSHSPLCSRRADMSGGEPGTHTNLRCQASRVRRSSISISDLDNMQIRGSNVCQGRVESFADIKCMIWCRLILLNFPDKTLYDFESLVSSLPHLVGDFRDDPTTYSSR